MSIIRRRDQRKTTTPNAVMTTLASPGLGGAELALWRVAMQPGQTGPVHRIDGEQVWSVTAGCARLEIDGESVSVEAGDTAVLSAGVLRQITADPVAGFEAVVASRPELRASMADGTDRGVPPWIA